MKNEASVETHGWKTAAFLIMWLLPPFMLRIGAAALIVRSGAPEPFSTSTGSAGILLGFTQDVFVAVQAMILCVVAQRVWKRPLKPVAALNAVLMLIVLSYLVFDFLLFWKTGLRMNLAFLEYARMGSCFVSSFEAMGPWVLWVGLGAAMLYSFGCYRYFESKLIQRPPFRAGLALGFSLVLTPVAFGLIPSDIQHYSSNALFSIQHAWISQELSGAGENRRWKGAETGAPPLHEFSKAELFEQIDPAHPLLKRTTGFKGERLFDLSIDHGERPHVVFLFMESFRAADVGVLGGKHAVSPRFDRLSGKGIVFSRFHASSVQTSRAVFASFFGILPRFSHRLVLAPELDVPLVGIPDLFKTWGYRNAFFHNGPLAWDHQDTFFPNHGFDEMHGREEIRSAFPSASETSWGIHDEYLMRYVIDWLRRQDQEGVPSFLTVLTMSNHHPWQTPPHFSGSAAGPSGKGEYERFLRSFAYSDWCLGLFWDLLKKNGLDKRTILFILADTAQPMGEHGNLMQIRGLHQENLHIPLLIVAEGRIADPKIIDCIGSQVDLLPTVMDIFQIQGVNHSLGTSLVRKVKERTAFFNNPFLLGHWGVRKENHKYICSTDTGQESLYDLASDPGETMNIADGLPGGADRYRSLLTGTHELMERFYSREESLARGRLLKEDRRAR